jgi:hypothetical protein
MELRIKDLVVGQALPVAHFNAVVAVVVLVRLVLLVVVELRELKEMVAQV